MKHAKENAKKIGVLGGAGILTAAALAAKILGALYRVPLTRVLGAHGMGLYQSVFPVYALIVTLAGGGLTAAVSKLIAENGEFTVKTGIGTALAFSVPLTLCALAVHRRIAEITGASEAALALGVLLPSVPVSAAAAVLRGYFLGSGHTGTSALGQLSEQAVKFAVGLISAFALKNVSLAASVAGCAAGVTAGEIAAAALYGLRCKSAARRVPAKSVSETVATDADGLPQPLAEVSAELVPAAASDLPSADLPPAEVVSGGAAAVREPRWHALFASPAFRLIRLAFPITLGLLVLPFCQVLDSFIVVNVWVRSGMDPQTATALYGLVTGPVAALINMPAVFTVGVCGMLLPRVSQLLKTGGDVRRAVVRAGGATLLLSVLFFAGLALFAPLGMRILCGTDTGVPLAQAALLLRSSAVSVPLVCVVQLSSSVLQGGGKAFLPVLHLCAAAAVKEALLFFLLPRFGALGFVLALDAFYFAAAVLDAVAVWRFLASRGKKSTG